MLEPSALSTSAPNVSQSVVRAWGVLVVHSFHRLWRVRQMGWVSLGLLAVVVAWVAVVAASPAGWELRDRRVRRWLPTYREYAEQQLPQNRYDPKRYDTKFIRGVAPVLPHEVPAPLNPLKNSMQTLILSIPHAVLQSERFVKDWGFMNFSRWVMLGAFLGFVLPLFTLSYGTAAFGTDRESRSLVWLMTRPIPRSGIYLAKFLGALPWCVLFGLGGFAALCLAGGEHGRRAFALYWPAAVLATITFAALFHLIGAIFRRPVVVGLVYVFFFEALVGSLPGSLKLLSLTFYARCLMYNSAQAAGYPVEMLEVSQTVTSTTALAVLSVAAVALTVLGMLLFARSEYRDDV
jgi:ABC-type transport system involved in multi-copper enzyme maturation permease subunit